MQVKALPCIFLLGVTCSFRKDADDFRPMEMCFSCQYYKRFLKETQEEDVKVMDEIEKIHKFGYPKSFGVSKS